MNTIKHKISQKSGSSMILALVFLLFCTFVGGSVLAMSSANGARIRDYGDSQQAFLDQRSAVRLLKDALEREYRPAAGAALTAPPPLRLTVNIITETRQTAVVKSGGVITPSGDVHSTVKFSFAASDTESNKPVMQRLVYESAILRVLNQYGYEEGVDSLKLSEFSFVSPSGGAEQLRSLSDFWLESPDSNGLTITLNDETLSDRSVVSTADLICEGGGDPYHVWVSFGEDESSAQVSLKLAAIVSERPAQKSQPKYQNERKEGGKTVVDMVTKSTETVVISWDTPEIVKGGVAR